MTDTIKERMEPFISLLDNSSFSTQIERILDIYPPVVVFDGVTHIPMFYSDRCDHKIEARFSISRETRETRKISDTILSEVSKINEMAHFNAKCTGIYYSYLGEGIIFEKVRVAFELNILREK